MCKCPYCGRQATFHPDTLDFYSVDYGPQYRCTDCCAKVGCHKGTRRPLGTLAKKELRLLREDVHRFFDPLWKAAMRQGRKKSEARAAAYNWLSQQMKIPIAECHIGLFGIDQCNQAIKIINQWKRNLKK